MRLEALFLLALLLHPRFRMPRNFRGRGRVVSARRQTGWSIGPSALPATLGTTAHQLWATGIVPSSEGVTLNRIRGAGILMMSSASAAGDGFDGAMGIGMATDEAFAAGVASTPSPRTDSAWDGWIWHEFMNVHQLSATEDTGFNAVAAVYRFVIDSKVMRKVPVGYTVFGAFDLVENGTAIGELFVNSRTLALLP